MADNPFLFIVGTARSGTTLLRRMVDAHSQIAVTRETHWITRFYRDRIGLDENGFVQPGLVDELFACKRFPHLRVNPDKVRKLLSAGPPLHYRDFVSGIFELVARKKGKPLVADKTPPYVRHIDLLHELFPAARFVHIIRDGRDVCLSMRNWRNVHKAAGRRATWNEDPVTTIALWWEWLVRAGREAGSRLGPGQYHEISYERLVAQPAVALGSLCGFLGVEFEPGMLEYHRGKTRADPKLSANAAVLPPTPGLRDWRTQLPEADQQRFEAAVGPLLDELGMERACPEPSPAVLRHARDIRSRFDT